MITNSFIVDYLGNSKGAPIETAKKKDSSNSASHPSFIDTLNSTVDKNSNRKNFSSNQKKPALHLDKGIDKRVYNNNEAKAKADNSKSDKEIKSYKDAVRENDKLSAEKNEKTTYDKTVYNDENINKTDEKKTVKSEAEVVLESMAQILNISVEELNQLLSTLNISPKDFADESKTSEITDKISDLLGLNSQQKETLKNLAEFTISKAKSVVSDKAKSIVSEIKVQDDETAQDKKADWVKLEGVDVEVVETDKKVQLQSPEQLGSKIKEVLSQLENKLEKESGKVFEDISNKIEEIADIDQNEIKANTFEASEQKEESDSTENNEDNSSDPKMAEIDLKKTAEENTFKSNTQEADQPQFDNILNNQQLKTDGASELSKVQKEANVSKKEIISQIVEKAKVVLTDDKSEMIIHLKPDHLGKLSLKIVTERGAVVAKFIAESEQVKAAIESNMDNLKESLTKQGFSIQGFSVSVGQESRKNFDEGYGLSKNNKGKGENVISTATVGVSAIEETQQKLNPYLVSNSNIDLTA
jgi:flagellar hook-length control protein FliK